MDALKPFSFSNLIAFLLPGFVGAYGLSYLFPTLRSAFATLTAPAKDAAGMIVFVVLTSLALGLAISALRSEIWDSVCHRQKGCVELETSPLNSKQRIEAYNLVVESTYRYYQFSANMASALLALMLGRSQFWLKSPFHFDLGQLALFVSAIALLATSYRQYYRMNRQLHGVLVGMGLATLTTRVSSNGDEETSRETSREKGTGEGRGEEDNEEEAAGEEA